MGFLGGNSEEKQRKQEEKQQAEINKFTAKYNLDSIDENDLIVVRRIANDLAGNGFLKAGMALSFAKGEEQAKVTYLSALTEQNWLIINQLSRLNSNIEKLMDK